MGQFICGDVGSSFLTYNKPADQKQQPGKRVGKTPKYPYNSIQMGAPMNEEIGVTLLIPYGPV